VAELNALPTELAQLTGAQDLFDWFGYWPSFHDAEVISVHLNRAGSSSLVLHDAWEPTKHVVITFLLYEILESTLEGFNHQNVLFGLELVRKDSGFELTLDSSFGLGGRIVAQRVEISLVAGEPTEVGPSNATGRPIRGAARPLTKEERSRLAAEDAELERLRNGDG
jgi:hypothetical protein